MEITKEQKEKAQQELETLELKKLELQKIIKAKEVAVVPTIMDRIKSYEDACADQNIKPLTLEHFNFLPERQRKASFAFHKLDTINFSLCEDWVADYVNSNQSKYYAWFYFDKTSGFGFVGTLYGHSHTRTTVGARLCSENRAKAEYFATQFGPEWNDFFSNL